MFENFAFGIISSSSKLEVEFSLIFLLYHLFYDFKFIACLP
uniref:Uncharacterized protein n=1 Tax=Rhizophora mucronata TaxID=61149 RepID=A0A2P2PD41_RHIMU